jgi:hypothetical protein
MEPAIGLEIARAVGDDLLLRRKAKPATQPQTRGRVGVDDGGVDPFMDDRDPIAATLRIF